MATRKKALETLITGITGQDGAYFPNRVVHGHSWLNSSWGVVHKGGDTRCTASSDGPRLMPIMLNTERIDSTCTKVLSPRWQTMSAFASLALTRLTLHYGDLVDSTNLIRIVQEVQPDEVYNLAAQSHVRCRARSEPCEAQFRHPGMRALTVLRTPTWTATEWMLPTWAAGPTRLSTAKMTLAGVLESLIRILGLESTCPVLPSGSSSMPELFGKVPRTRSPQSWPTWAGNMKPPNNVLLAHPRSPYGGDDGAGRQDEASYAFLGDDNAVKNPDDR